MVKDHTQDLYALLGIAPTAEDRDIKASYRDAARRFHPDVNHNQGAGVQFREITEAYEVLNDPSQRRSYDSMRTRLADEPQYFNTVVTPSKRVLPILGEPQVVYVLAQISADKQLAKPDQRHTPLNLALVLDRSKSMSGARMDRVKVAANQIVDQLGPDDYLSVVSFSDFADVIIAGESVTDHNSLKNSISTINPDGGTKIFQGLSVAMNLVIKNLDDNLVNHIVLLTDGKTYDDESLSLELADEAAEKGIGISTMGIGDEWNDEFLDDLATRTGGYSAYINSPGAVVRFMSERVRSLGASFAERVNISIAPDPDVRLESVFKLMPNPQPIEHATQPIPLGNLEATRPITLLIQLQMTGELQAGFRTMLRVSVTADVLHAKRRHFNILTDLSIEVAQDPPAEDPPRMVLDALGKLTLYRMQQKAEAAIKAGNFGEATRRLENLADRLHAVGEDKLAETARREASRIQHTQAISEEGRMSMKYGTRLLLNPGENGQDDDLTKGLADLPEQED
jgi:Ca-activated chloride channel family protein